MESLQAAQLALIQMLQAMLLHTHLGVALGLGVAEQCRFSGFTSSDLK